MENSSDSSKTKGGNNNPLSSACAKNTTAQPSPIVKWVFTKFIDWTNSSEDPTILAFENSLQKICKKYFYGKEISPTTGKPHLQGYFELNKKMRRTAIVKYAHLNMFLSPAKGDEEANLSYTSKEDRHFTFWEKPKKNPSDIIRKNIPDEETAIRVLLDWGSKPNSFFRFTPDTLQQIISACNQDNVNTYDILIGFIRTELEGRDAGASLLREWRS